MRPWAWVLALAAAQDLSEVLPARGQRQQKHAAEMAARAKPAPPEAAGGTGIVGPDKNEDGWTISWRYKRDLYDMFGGIAANWTVLEVGAYLGYSTRVLAEIFQRVIALDSSQYMLDRNAAMNAQTCPNVFYLQFHTALDDWRALSVNPIDVVFLDAEHDHRSARRDLENVLRLPSVRIIVFDDYGAEKGVRAAVDEFLQAGVIEVIQPIGHRPPWQYRDRTIEYPEGLVCRVREGAAEAYRQPPTWLNHRYAWYGRDFTQYAGTVDFRDGGVLNSDPWGDGIWQAAPDGAGVMVRFQEDSRAPYGGAVQMLEFNEYRTSFVAHGETVAGVRAERETVGVRMDFIKVMMVKMLQAFQ